MNARERVLAILLGCVIILGGAGFFGYQFVYVPWAKRTKDLANLKADYAKKQQRVAEIEGHRAELARWRMLSLPAEPDVARREYEKYLNEMLSRHRVAPGYTIAAKPLDKQAAAGAAKDKEPIYQKLTFTVSAEATMPNLVAVLEEFYKTGLLHEIKSLSIQRQLTNTDPTKANDLTVHMTIEALIVIGADKRSYVLPNIDRRLLAVDLAAALQHGPTGLGLVLWAAGPSGPAGPGLLAGGRRAGAAPSDAAMENVFLDPPRRYASIARKNVFLGRPPADSDDLGPPEWMAPRFVHLTGITTNDIGRTTGSLFDVSTNRWSRLRATSGFDQFIFVKDGNKKGVLRGVVVKMEDRDVIYRAEIAAEDPPDNRSGEREGFFRLDKKQRDKLVADKIVTAEEAACVYRVERSYWDSLLKSLVIRERDSTSFRIQLEKDSDKPVEDVEQGNSVEVLRGKVIQTDAGELLVHVESRYYMIHLGQSLADSLKKPLPREQVKGLKLVTN
jgi:hypothetical protein